MGTVDLLKAKTRAIMDERSKSREFKTQENVQRFVKDCTLQALGDILAIHRQNGGGGYENPDAYRIFLDWIWKDDYITPWSSSRFSLLHFTSVMAYPNFIARDLVKRAEYILDEAASHHSLPEAGTSIPEELKSLPFEFLPLESRLLKIVAFCFAAPGENQQLKGLSQEQHGQWLTNEIIPTSGEVDHQEKPAGTDDYRALNELHSPKVETEAGVGSGEHIYTPASSIPNEMKDKDEESLQEAKRIKFVNRERTSAQMRYNYEHYKNSDLSEDAVTGILLRDLNIKTHDMVTSKIDSPELKTQADAQLFVQHYALQALAELKQDIPKFAKRSRRDEKYFIDRLAKIEDLIRQNTGVPRDPILDSHN
ncbi:hypothetical protein PSHT_15909 [Puccinia striiformis]|uniref:Uncharacterized protein n=1 Tax=Puccinia striiformis TaxID=27350 RepID=A0A2S4UCT6_9BASI|nr:hypothetical protein PSHT_15909 [Puccinia striiformis]